MIRTMMHAKLHGARVTDHNLEYEGSITLPRDLMDAVGILLHERVQIVNKNNGNRFETYVIEAPAGSGQICVNGAAARLVSRGDEVLVIAYAQMSDEEARSHKTRVAFLAPDNSVVEVITSS